MRSASDLRKKSLVVHGEFIEAVAQGMDEATQMGRFAYRVPHVISIDQLNALFAACEDTGVRVNGIAQQTMGAELTYAAVTLNWRAE